jgi:16S rRNA (uracil1498-N3)-methyltransferase
LEPLGESAAAPLRITLCASLFKFDRFEWLVEKATELGVDAILPVVAARSDKGLAEASRKRSERWRRIAYEAGQQSRRLSPPEIRAAASFAEVLLFPAPFRYFLDETGGDPLLRALPAGRPTEAHAALLTGPEGGWTEAEREAAIAAGWLAASLGPQILRAETAALAGVAILASAWIV